MKDYFPLKAGVKSTYAFRSSEFVGEALVTIVILKVETRKEKTVAHARMTTKLKGHETSVDYEITKSKTSVVTCDGIVVGGRTEFIFPLKEGVKWNEYPDANEIVSLTDKLKFNNQKYESCMKIMTSIAGGDGGTSVRYYAPGIGYIHEVYDAEDMHCDVLLLSVSKASEDELKEQKRNIASSPDDSEDFIDNETDLTIKKKSKAKSKAKTKPKSKPKTTKAKVKTTKRPK